MNNRIKKKLGNRLNIKKWCDAPNIVGVITDRNRYLRRNIGLSNLVFFNEDDMTVFYTKDDHNENK